jgi:hypothetical protein
MHRQTQGKATRQATRQATGQAKRQAMRQAMRQATDQATGQATHRGPPPPSGSVLNEEYWARNTVARLAAGMAAALAAGSWAVAAAVAGPRETIVEPEEETRAAAWEVEHMVEAQRVGMMGVQMVAMSVVVAMEAWMEAPMAETLEAPTAAAAAVAVVGVVSTAVETKEVENLEIR